MNNLQMNSPGLPSMQHFLCQLLFGHRIGRRPSQYVQYGQSNQDVTFLSRHDCHQVLTLLQSVRNLSSVD